MERMLSRAALAAAVVVAALPAAASADKPAAPPGNGAPGRAGNPNHQQAATPPGRAHSNGQPAHGTPAPHAAPAHPAHPAHPVHPAAPAQRSRAATPAPRTHTNNGVPHQKTTICHATGSATNPYVEITISNRAVKAHARHQDGRDIIPAPAGGCPTAAASAQPAAAVGASIQAAASRAASPSGQSHVAGVIQTNRRGTGGTKAAAATEPAATEPAAATAATHRHSDASLPFTGMNVLLALLIAGGLILAGVTVRRAASGRRTTA
jgi:hypothetical protein